MNKHEGKQQGVPIAGPQYAKAVAREQGPRLLAAPGEAFCTSPARFAILGREQCAERFYGQELFTPISARDRDGLVVEFEDRDFLQPGEHPRQMQAASSALPDVVTDSGPVHGHDPAAAPNIQDSSGGE